MQSPLTKTDELSNDDFDRFSHEKDLLLKDVKSIDDHACPLLIAARPADGTSVRGLDELIDWLCSSDRLKDSGPHLPHTPFSRGNWKVRFMNCRSSTVGFLGFPRTGKSTYLGALWQLVQDPAEPSIVLRNT